MLRQISLPIARMKRYLLILLTALGLIAFAPTKSRAQDFSVSFGGAPGYYAPGYYGEPGPDIITGAFTIVLRIITVNTTADITIAAIIAAIIGTATKTMIDRCALERFFKLCQQTTGRAGSLSRPVTR